MAAAPDRLSPGARSLVESTDNDLYLSAASAWEISIKHSLGKLKLPEDPVRYVPSRLDALRVSPLAIETGHALQAGALPPHHRDPFDRLLIAQAILEDLPILTSDRAFKTYNVVTIEA
jgi:PIN domain nuclease of toxin-antitoxin system